MSVEEQKALILINGYLFPKQLKEQDFDVIQLQIEYMTDHDLFNLANQDFKTKDLEIQKVPLVSLFVRIALLQKGYNHAIM
ncbi:MAG: hypothetical protein ACRC1D_03975 [Culicoidibacterales bacterium]